MNYKRQGSEEGSLPLVVPTGSEEDNYDEVPTAKAKANIDYETRAGHLAESNRHPANKDNNPPNAGWNDSRTWVWILGFHPFIRYFGLLADSRGDSKRLPHQRFNNLVQKHPKLYALCVGLDIVVLLTVLTFIACLAWRVANKLI